MIACNIASRSCSSLVTIPNLASIDTFLVNGLAISSNYLFITDVTNGNLWRYQLPSGPLATIATASTLLPYVAADSTYVYWATSSGGTVSVMRMLQTGSASSTTPEFVTSVSGALTGLAVDGSNVCLSATTGSGSSEGGFVAYAPLPGIAGDVDSGTADAGPSAATKLYQGDPVGALGAGGGAVVWFDETTLEIYGQRVP
jgi:hypothetical protein